MDPIRNDLQWPSIEVLARKVSYPLERYMGTTVELSARILQHHVRRHQRGLPLTEPFSSSFAQGDKLSSSGSLCLMTRFHLMSFFCGPDSASASIKLDGTNLGIDADDGALYGRRLRVEDDATSYQKTDIQFLRGRQGQVSRFRKALGLSESATFRLYGELMCNDRFDYDLAGLHKGFRVFGAVVDVSSLSDDTCREALQHITGRLGVACRISGGDGDESPLLVLQANDAFRSLLDECSDSPRSGASTTETATVAELSRGSLVSIVEDTFEWMAGCHGEGLVLTWRWASGSSSSSGDSSYITAKYKTAAEPQGATTAVLEKTIASVEAFAAKGLGFLLPPGVATSLLPRMLAVSKAEKPVGSRAASAHNSKKKKQQKTDASSDEGEAKRHAAQVIADEALTSALTKFDAPAEYFKKADGRRLLVDLLVKEMQDDLLSAGANEESKRADDSSEGGGGSSSSSSSSCNTEEQKPSESELLRAGRRAVERFVGMSFGAWKKAQQQQEEEEEEGQ